MKLATKVKLVVNLKEKEQLTQTMIAFNRAANYISRVAFENKTFGQVNLHKLVYYEIKQKYNLSSQLAIRAIGKVVDVYKNKKQRVGIVSFKEMGSIDYKKSFNQKRQHHIIGNSWKKNKRKIQIP